MVDRSEPEGGGAVTAAVDTAPVETAAVETVPVDTVPAATVYARAAAAALAVAVGLGAWRAASSVGGAPEPVGRAAAHEARVREEGRPPLAPLAPRAPGADLDGFSARDLRGLPGLGRGRAERLVAARAERAGRHLGLDDGIAVEGVGAGTVARLRGALERRRRALEPHRPSEPAPAVAIDPPDT